MTVRQIRPKMLIPHHKYHASLSVQSRYRHPSPLNG